MIQGKKLNDVTTVYTMDLSRRDGNETGLLNKAKRALVMNLRANAVFLPSSISSGVVSNNHHFRGQRGHEEVKSKRVTIIFILRSCTC